MSTDSTPTSGTETDDVEALRREVEQLRERVADLETQVGSSSSTLPPAAKDHRDARVLEALDEGDTVTLQDFRRLFRERTDIRDSDTLRERIKFLSQSEAFERLERRRWRYLGPGGER